MNHQLINDLNESCLMFAQSAREWLLFSSSDHFKNSFVEWRETCDKLALSVKDVPYLVMLAGRAQKEESAYILGVSSLDNVLDCRNLISEYEND